MPSPSQEILNPLSFVLPNISEAVRDTMAGQLGMLIYNTDTNKIDVCVNVAIAAASWHEVTSA